MAQPVKQTGVERASNDHESGFEIPKAVCLAPDLERRRTPGAFFNRLGYSANFVLTAFSEVHQTKVSFVSTITHLRDVRDTRSLLGLLRCTP
jgi:hypothetical protein